MRVLPTFVKGFLWRAGASLLLALALFSFETACNPNQVHAGFVPVLDSAVVAELATLNGLQATQVAASTQLTLKEIVLDGVVFGLVNTLIDKLGDEVVNWINSGFEDTPMFVQDPGGFMLHAADQATGRLIAEMGLERFICDPLMLPSLQLALNLDFGINTGRWQREFYCTFGRAASIHADTFMGGDFMGGGGWDAWVDMSVRNQNIIGASAAAGVMMDKRIAMILGMEENKLNWNKGFFSSTNIQGYIKTPGTVIENKINDTFDSSSRRIEMADEISEIIGALINLAMKSLMTGLASNNSSATNYNARYSTNVTYSSNDYQNLRESGVLLPPETISGNIPTFTGSPAVNQTYVQSSTQGPRVCDDSSCGDSNWPHRIQHSGLAIDGNKNVQMMHSSMAHNDDRFGLAWWKGSFGTRQYLSELKITTGLDYYNDNKYRENARTDGLRPRFYTINPLSGVETEITSVRNRSGATVPITCRIHYTDQNGNSATSPGCIAPLLEVESFRIELIEPVPTDVVRLERTRYLTLNEVEFFKRNGPTFMASQSTSTAIGSFFDPFLGISAKDTDGNDVPVTATPASPLASTTYLSYAPDGALRPFVFSSGNIVAPSNELGNWRFVYLASDAYGIHSNPMERVVTVRAQTTASRANPLILIDGSTPTATQTIDVGGQPTLVATGDSYTIGRGNSFDPFQKISARDAEGAAYFTSTVPGVRATYSRNAPNGTTFLYETMFDSTKPGTWRVIFDFTDRYGASALPVLRTITVNP